MKTILFVMACAGLVLATPVRAEEQPQGQQAASDPMLKCDADIREAERQISQSVGSPKMKDVASRILVKAKSRRSEGKPIACSAIVKDALANLNG